MIWLRVLQDEMAARRDELVVSFIAGIRLWVADAFGLSALGIEFIVYASEFKAPFTEGCFAIRFARGTADNDPNRYEVWVERDPVSDIPKIVRFYANGQIVALQNPSEGVTRAYTQAMNRFHVARYLNFGGDSDL